MILKRFLPLCALIPVIILLGSAQISSAQEVVLYASQAPVKVGNWSAVADSTAAGGARLSNTNLDAAKIVTASANPADYAELTFNALPGIPYHLWMRGKVLNNSPYGDSVFVQFSGSTDSSGNPIYRIGTTSATEYNLEDCSGCGLANWGWQDNGWGVGVLGPQIYFQSAGTQTIRIQVREDGLSIDQIVLSPSTYLFNSPGALKNDSTILAPSAGPTPTPTPTPVAGQESPNNTRIPPGTQIIDSTGAVWTRTSDGTILRNGLGTSGTGSDILYCNRIVYVLGTDSQWWKWSNGWYAAGVADPCGGATPTPTPTQESPNNTRVPPGTQIVDSTGAIWTRTANGTILRNGASTSGTGSVILYCNRIVYVLGTDSQWYKWSNGWTPVGSIDPCGATPTPTPPQLQESANNTRVPPGTQIVDRNLDVWTLVSGSILRNGGSTNGTGSQILYCNRVVYAFGTDSQWYSWGPGWAGVGYNDPCGVPAPTPTPTPAPVPNQPPTVSISANPTSGNSPLLVSFSASGSDPDGFITSYQWNFGNGATAAGQNVTNTYSTAGSYTARVTATDNLGATASATVVINVSAPAQTGGSLRVMSWNIDFGTGTDSVVNFDRTAQYVANLNPDIAGLCEMPSENISEFLGYLSQRTGRSWFWHFIPKYNGTTEGNLIISKYSFSSTGGQYLSYQRSVAQVTLVVGGRTINFFATHLDPSSSTARYQEVQELMAYASGFSESRIIVGDFNAGPDLSESALMTSAYYDGWIGGMNSGTAVAYPDNPVGVQTRTRRGRIDYVYQSTASPSLALQGTQIPDMRNLSQTNVVVLLGTLDDKGVRPSDHNAMIATFLIQ